MEAPKSLTPLAVLRAQLPTLAMVFLLPLLTLGFVAHATRSFDARFIEHVQAQLDVDATLTPAQRVEVRALYERVRPSVSCVSGDPAHAEVRGRMRSLCSDVEQFDLARRFSLGALLAGLVAILLGAGIALLAWTTPSAQYPAFVLGWRGMQVLAAAETAVQGALAVWLSYWLTAFFLKLYILKLIAVVALVAVVMSWGVLRAIFLAPAPPRVDAVPLPEADAAALRDGMRELCARVGTEGPANVLTGIDDNFFVTESALQVNGGEVRGRTLYVSLALLRVLSREEADAVLAHELGHFVGGDTDFTRRMGPRLAASHRYLAALHEDALPVYYFMSAFFTAFDLALVRTERDREFAADAVAARVVSGEALSRALLKIAAYSNYRTRVEAKLFAADTAHAQLSIAERIAAGFAGYVQGDDFANDMRGAATPHPFDTHPKLQSRIDAVGVRAEASEYAALALRPAEGSWVTALPGADALEASLWGEYERRFADAHEFALAVRYLPETAEQEAHVLRYFPPRAFETELGDVRVTFRDLTLPAVEAPIALGEILSMTIEERMYKRYLDVRLRDRTLHSLQLSSLGGEEQDFLAALGDYEARHREAHRLKAERDAKGTAPVTA